jgi:hypothetical protein
MGDLKQRLLQWAQKCAAAHGIASVANLTEAFSDGRVLLAVLHAASPTKVPYRPLPTSSGTLALAVEAAAKHFGVDSMLDPAEGARATGIEKVMVMYLTELYLALPNAGKGVNTDSPTGRSGSRPARGALGEASGASGAAAAAHGGERFDESTYATAAGAFDDRSLLATRGGATGSHGFGATQGSSPSSGGGGGGGGGYGADALTPTRELEVDALRRRCYELEHAANALPATLDKLRELQAYTKDLATQYELQVADLEASLQQRRDAELAWKTAAASADSEVEALRRAAAASSGEVEGMRRALAAQKDDFSAELSRKERALAQQVEDQQAAYEAELRGVRAELAQSAEWWRGRVDAVRDEEEQHTEEVEEHVESLSQMLVQAEKQLTLTKSALEESTAAREQLKATVGSLERHNEDLARQLEARSGEIKRLRGEGEDAKRTAHVFEEELRSVATRLSEVDSEKGGLAKRIDSYHTQEDNYRRHASELVDFSSRAGAALAQAVKDALASVELLNKVKPVPLDLAGGLKWRAD